MTLNAFHRKRSVAIVCHEQNKDDFKSYEIHFVTQQHTVHMRHNVYCYVVKIQNVEHVQQLTQKIKKKITGLVKCHSLVSHSSNKLCQRGPNVTCILHCHEQLTNRKQCRKNLFVDTTCGRTKTHCRREGRKQLLCFRLRIEDTEQNLQ